jgi:hypothetical protein
MTDTLKVSIACKRRSLLSRLFILPFVFRRHYAIARKHEGRIVSAYAAWLMAGLIIRAR